MFKRLTIVGYIPMILQQLYNISSTELEDQVNAWLYRENIRT
jgi:hypothetical protein